MARLSEIPYVIRTVGAWTFCKRIYCEVSEDGVFNMAAAVAYYWLLAMFPLVIFLASLATVLPAGPKEALRFRITVWIYANLTQEVADAVWIKFDSILREPKIGLLSIGLLLTLWAASNGMNATMTALDRCYNVTKPRPFIFQRGLSIVITISGVTIALLLALLLPVTTVILNYFERSPDYVPPFARGGAKMAIDIARYSIGITLVILLVSTVYQFGVSIRRRWTLVSPGAVFAVFGIMAMAWAFNWYVDHFGTQSYNKTYGVLGGVVIVLLLFNYYAVVFLIGAEINSEIDYAVLQGRLEEGEDPVPEAHDDPSELERFRRSLEKHGAKFIEIHRKRAAKVEKAEGASADDASSDVDAV